MLKIKIPATEQWDEDKEEFVYSKEQTLCLEHSLVSLSKWESKWCKPYLTNNEKTIEETIDYIKFMTLTQNVNEEIYNLLTEENIEDITNYIKAPMTATTFSKEDDEEHNSRQITSELVYYWMFSLNIPIECQKWHLNRLITLIRVFNAENKPRKQMSEAELMKRNARLNAERRKKLKSKG